jgi:hypothetical protein
MSLTIDQLIAELQRLKEENIVQGDTIVTVNGYDGGLTDLQVKNIELLEVALNYNTSGYTGEHEQTDYINDYEEFSTAKVLNLGR